MGCGQSKPDDFTPEEDYIPQNDVNNNNNSNQQSVPPIVITKAHSAASIDSSLPPSTSANAHAADTKTSSEQVDDSNGSETPHSEKPPVIIEERTQVHEYGEPTNLVEQAGEDPVVIRQVKPIVINSPPPPLQDINEPTVVPASSIPQAKAAAVEVGVLAPSSTESTPSDVSTPWSILIRHNSSSSKDTAIEIPTMEPFMTVSELKSKIHVENDQQIKLIHLGKILQDSSVLMPSSCAKSQLKKNAIKVSNRGVIQAMIYKK